MLTKIRLCCRLVSSALHLHLAYQFYFPKKFDAFGVFSFLSNSIFFLFWEVLHRTTLRKLSYKFQQTIKIAFAPYSFLSVSLFVALKAFHYALGSSATLERCLCHPVIRSCKQANIFSRVISAYSISYLCSVSELPYFIAEGTKKRLMVVPKRKKTHSSFKSAATNFRPTSPPTKTLSVWITVLYKKKVEKKKKEKRKRREK